MKKESIIKIIEACVLLVLGVLFCVFGAIEGNSILSTILGIALIVAGTAILVMSIIKDKSTIAPIGLAGLLAISLGIFFIVADVVNIIYEFVPYILLVFGSALFIDAFIGYFARKEKVIAAFIIKLIVGAALITIGALLLTNVIGNQAVGIIVGVALILIAIVNIVIEFFKANKQ